MRINADLLHCILRITDVYERCWAKQDPQVRKLISAALFLQCGVTWVEFRKLNEANQYESKFTTLDGNDKKKILQFFRRNSSANAPEWLIPTPTLQVLSPDFIPTEKNSWHKSCLNLINYYSFSDILTKLFINLCSSICCLYNFLVHLDCSRK